MAFLEMSRDEAHGGTGWEFLRCVWSPEKKKSGVTWPFWSKISNVQMGDTVVHLRGVGRNAAFVGSSIASTDGFRTTSRPPKPGKWEFANAFLRAELSEFLAFPSPIYLAEIFANRRAELESHFQRNKVSKRQNLFFVLQSGRLQCLNGAYLSDMDEPLLNALFGSPLAGASSRGLKEVQTAECLTNVRARIGQSAFSDAIRSNYRQACCFPSCNIADRRFLVASHITRWSDNESLRGHVGNGLCLCLMHDKAFEVGLFTLDEQHRVFANNQARAGKSDLDQSIAAAHGKRISTGEILPLLEALTEHWKRIRYSPADGRSGNG